MKRILTGTILLLILVVCVFNLSSCQELNIDSQTEFPIKLETDAQSQYNVLATSPRTIVFNISSNTPWKITSDKEWCTPTPAMSSSSSLIAEVSLDILDNPNEQSRMATLTITGENYEPQTIITVTQDAKSKLVVQWIDEKMESGESTAEFKITSNKAWRATSSSMWLTLSQESGAESLEPITITASATANPGKERTATVTISNGLEEQTYEVTQKGYILELAGVEEMDKPFEFTGTGNGSTIPEQNIKTYNVNANIEWDVTTEADWIELTKNDNATFTAKVKNEYYFDTRKATILLQAKDKTLGLEPVEIPVEQKGGEVNYEGTNHTVDATNGHLILNTTQRVTSRFSLKGKRKLAIYEWKFSSSDFTVDRAIDLNMDGKPAAHMWMGPNVNYTENSNKFQIAGSFYSLHKDKVTQEKRNEMRTLRVEVKYKDNATDKVIYDVYLNDEKVMDTVEINADSFSAANAGYSFYFGFHQSSSGTASMTISSFEVTPVE